MATAKKAAKTATKKSAAKKPIAKKSAAKKSTATKSAAKKPAAKKSAAKKSAAKKSAAKKPAAKKSTAKKSPSKKSPSKKAPVTKAVKKAPKSPFGKKFIDEMKDRLITERAKYLHSAEEYLAEADALIEGREPGDVQFDEESGEGDTMAVERERDLALSAQARAAVEQIDAALERIEAGTYGVCVASGLSVPQERLRAIPWAAERVEYKVGGLGRR
jgi:RNA polymerase-binding transcription factor DksA